ncbi:inositol hexakisphosphate and diphosphoinositol-pentakisphosphate kinase 2 isoform X19 [Diorhabda carinulata]|uniref:inositol hexakisphosphate and diphosphoinositol-pentakisphosphate kinase 2 isoform X19 n=1 Tax=Diorhabda carinulata TaxID=1163345 RepID=UPI0025A00EE1|nr:inositol hexakisphosphate and diphosphoinositol-pentakisphosphate kinase 2 isoform X19 [Diorhabda carinulata]
MEWAWLKDWWRLKKWRKYRRASDTESLCFCDECFENEGDIELCDSSDISISPQDMEEDVGKVVIVGVCAMEKKTQSKPMKEILTRLQEFEYIKVIVFEEEVILQKPVDEWPVCDCLISFHSKGFPLDKAIQYAQLHNPYVINNLHMQYDIQDRRKVYATLDGEGIEIPRYAVLDRDSLDPKHHELVESEDHVEVNGVIFNKPFVEKPVSAEDHNIYIYYPTSAGGGSQRLFRKIGSRSSVYSPESRVRKTGSFIYEDFMPTDGTDVKVYTVGPDYAHAEARKSPALDGKVERDRDGKEIRYPVILSNAEKLISRKVCLAFKQAVCGFDLLRANGKSFVCDVNGFSFVKNSNKYYDDCARILGNMILRELAPTLHIPWSVPFQLDDPPIVPTTFGKMMELRCVVAVIRHGDRTPKQKMKVEVRHPKFFEIFEKYDGYKHGHVKLKRPKQLQEILDIARSLLTEIQLHEADPEIEEKQGKLEQLKAVLEMYGHFSGINRKVQMKYQPKGRPRGSSSDDVDKPVEPSLVLILKWGGELTPAGRIQAEELGRIFRCMYPGGQGRHLAGEYAGAQGLGLLRLHSTFRHDLKIYASDEGRVQMTAAAFAKGLLALEGELTPILVQMVKSANTNGLLDNDCDSSKYQNMCKARLHELMQIDREFTQEDKEKINPCNSTSIADALEFVKNPVKCCKHVQELIKNLLEIVQAKKEDAKSKEVVLYHGETWELMGRRWGKIEKDFFTKNKTFDISKIPDIYDCIKYDLQHNQHTLQFEQAEELYTYAKYLADIVIPQEYGLTAQEKLTIGQGICTPLLKKIKADLQRNIEESGEETVNRLNPRYSHGVSSPGRHVRTRLYFTSESHIHSLITVLRHGGLVDVQKDEQWRRAMDYVSCVSELNYMSQIVIMLYEDPTKDPCSEERFHIELHFSPGVNCCVQKNLPPGPGFRPHSRNESATSKNSSLNTSETATPDDAKSRCSPRIDEEAEIAIEEEKYILHSPKGPDSPTNKELSPPFSEDIMYRGRSKISDPIPIGNSHTVSGHEAMHLAKRLNEELANQAAQQGSRSYALNRATSPELDQQRSRSYDHKSPHKGKAQKLHQSLDAVNSSDCGQNVVKRHRHSIAGQMSYYKMLGFGCGGPMGLKKLVGGSTNSLFSTAIISGSSSAPNLRDVITNSSNATAIDGFGGVPSIRPLETLHNALSLKQLDAFLDRMITAPIFKTPSSTPPKYPSTPIPTPTNGGSSCGLSLDKSRPLKLQSPCNSVGWSGPPSLMSSSGPSSPGYSDSNSKGSSSEMSSSIVSADGITVDNFNKIFPTAPGLDQDLGSVGMLLDSFDKDMSESLDLSDYYSGSNKPKGSESGDITPVSGSEVDFNVNDITMGSNADCDITVTEDIEGISIAGDENQIDPNETLTSARIHSLTNIFNASVNSSRAIDINNICQSNIESPKLVSPPATNLNIYTNVLNAELFGLRHVENSDRLQPSTSRIINEFNKDDLKTVLKTSNVFDKDIPSVSKNLSNSVSHKWSTSKEKFLENNFTKTDNIDFGKNLNVSADKKVEKEYELTKLKPGAVVIKEKYIEPLKISRVSKSFHGKSPTATSYLDVSNAQRRASDSPVATASNITFFSQTNKPESDLEMKKSIIRLKSLDNTMTQTRSHRSVEISKSASELNQAMTKTQRFTTTRVDEAEHAASIAKNISKTSTENESTCPPPFKDNIKCLDNTRNKTTHSEESRDNETKLE